MSNRCEKCGDSFLCAEHAQVQCGLSCPPDWPGHWRDWHSEDHNCATKGRAAAGVRARHAERGEWRSEAMALREKLAAAEARAAAAMHTAAEVIVERDRLREALRKLWIVADGCPYCTNNDAADAAFEALGVKP